MLLYRRNERRMVSHDLERVRSSHPNAYPQERAHRSLGQPGGEPLLVLPNLVIKSGDIDIDILDHKERLPIVLGRVLKRDIKVNTSRAKLNIEQPGILELDPPALLADPVGNVGSLHVQALDTKPDGAIVLGSVRGVTLGELKVIMRNESDRVRDERCGIEFEIINHQINVFALEFDSRHGDLLDQADNPGQHDVDHIPVQTGSISFQTVEPDFTGIRQVFPHGLDRVDQVGRLLVVCERVEERLEFFLQRRGVGFPGWVVPEEGLSIVVQGRSLSVCSLRNDVCGGARAKVSVGVRHTGGDGRYLQPSSCRIRSRYSAIALKYSVNRGSFLISSAAYHEKDDRMSANGTLPGTGNPNTHLSGRRNHTIHTLARQVLDKLFQIPTGLLDLFILITNIALLRRFIQRILRLVRVLFHNVHQGIDRLVVRLVLLRLEHDLLESGDEFVFCFIGGRQFFIKVLSRRPGGS